MKNLEELQFLALPEELCGLDPITYQYFHNLLKKRTVLFNDEVGSSIVEQVYLALKNFEDDDSNEPVTLIVNTLGGSVFDGLFLCNVIDNYKKPLNIICPAYCMSMGAIILCSGNKNPNVHKCCYRFSFGLIHAGEVGVQGENGSVKDVVEFNEKVNQKIKNYIVSHTNISEELYDKNDRKQWYMTAEDMLEYGLVDEIIDGDD